MDKARRLTVLEVTDFMENVVWRTFAAQIEIQRRKDIASLLIAEQTRKVRDPDKFVPDDILRGRIAKAEEILLLPSLLERKLRGLEKSERNEYTDEELPVDLA